MKPSIMVSIDDVAYDGGSYQHFRIYKCDLASHPRYDSFTIFLHNSTSFGHWLERRGPNVLARTILLHRKSLISSTTERRSPSRRIPFILLPPLHFSVMYWTKHFGTIIKNNNIILFINVYADPYNFNP